MNKTGGKESGMTMQNKNQEKENNLNDRSNIDLPTDSSSQQTSYKSSPSI
jgi:hypothetical protein